MVSESADIFADLGLPRPLNAAGYLTVNGAAPVDPEVVDAVAAILPHSVIMASLQDVASAHIVAATGVEAGCVTACAAAGIATSVAAAMTGDDLDRVRQLPDTDGMRDQVLLPRGHDCDFGAVVSQMIRLSGASPVFVGDEAGCSRSDIVDAVTDRTVAAVYVTSNHVDPQSAVPLPEFADALHAHGIPVIADCAAEDDLRAFLGSGADLALYSAHKVRRGPTAGIVAGGADLVAACRAQENGIGRPMKVGKEGVVGMIAALRRWCALDRASVAREWHSRIDLAIGALADVPGLVVAFEADPNDNPVPRARVTLDIGSRVASARELSTQLAAQNPPCLLRPTEHDPRSILLDPRSLTDAEMLEVCHRIRETCEGAS